MRVLLLVALFAPCIFANPIEDELRAIPAGSCGVNKYGQRELPYIVGGTTATPHFYPWQVSLQTSMGHMCGGSIIDSTHILTAAHCFGRDPYEYQWTVVVGKHSMYSTEPNEKKYSVAKIMKHEQYGPTQSNLNDITMLKLTAPITFSDDVQPVCVPAQNNSDLVGAMATVTGWGAMYSGGSVSSTLMQVQVPVMSNTQCQQNYAQEKISPGMICAGYAQGGKDACQGDSGGPFVVKSANGWVLVGIVSWGYGCADPGHPGVYTRVNYYRPWINSHLI